MRKWIGLILTVLLVIAFLPAGFGILAKKSLDQLVADLPMPDGMSLTLQNYTFGWLSSYVAIKVHMDENPQRASYRMNDALDIIVHGHIAHGPIVMTERGLRFGIARLDTHATLKDFQGLSPNTQQELAVLFKDQDILRASSLFHFSQGISIDLKSSPIHVQEAGDNIQWNGFNAHIKVNRDFDSLKTNVIISPILFTTAQGAMLDAAQAQFVAKLSREDQSIWVGEQVLSLPTFYLKDESGAVLRFDHLRLMSNSNIINQLLQATLDIKADNIELDNQHIEQLHFDIELSNLASDPLLALSQLMHKPQPWSVADKQQGFKLMTQALSPGADIELDYMLTMQPSPVLLRGMLRFPDISAHNENEALIAKQLLQGLTVRLEFMAPQQIVKDLLFDLTWSALVEQMAPQAPSAEQEQQIKQMTENQVAGLVQNGVLIARDDNYYLAFDYQQQQSVLNTRPISQGEIFLLLMLLLQVTPDESITP